MTRHRRNPILDLVRNDGSAHATSPARTFGVSTVTIRNPIGEAQKTGALVRDRGGAIAAPAPRQLKTLLGLNERATLNQEAKQRIGKAAATRRARRHHHHGCRDTVVEMASHLAGTIPLTVVTNALNVALTIGAATEAQVIFLGGTLSREASSTVGPLAEQTLANLAVQKVFLARKRSIWRAA